MSMFSVIATKLKEIFNKMVKKETLEKTLHVSPAISTEMEHAIELWHDMYTGHAPWLKEATFADPIRVASLGLPALIAREKARMCMLEWQSEITTPKVQTGTEQLSASNSTTFGTNQVNSNLEVKQENKNNLPNYNVNSDTTLMTTVPTEKPVGKTDRADYLNSQYKKLKRNLLRQLEYGIAKGGLVIKPYVVNNEDAKVKTMTTEDGNRVVNDVKSKWEMEFDFTQADNFYPITFDANGNITEAAFLQSKITQDITYRRLEYHKFENNTVTVLNKAYKSTNTRTDNGMRGVDLGQECPLSEVPEWASLEPEIQITDVDRPLFAYFKMPEANTIDTLSPLGVSGFSRVVNLIKDADMQYSRLLWEYEGGELAVDIDRDALRPTVDANGNVVSVRPMLQQRLFRNVDLGSESDTYQPFAPILRDNSYRDGLNTILMHIEDNTGLARGTISDVGVEAKTATEIMVLKQRNYQTNAEIQRALQYALEDTIYIMDTLCDLYDITPDGEYDVSFEWDDSLLVNIDEELSKRLLLQSNNLASRLENRMWYFGETERQAQEALLKIDQANLDALKQNIALQQGMGNSQEQGDENKENNSDNEKKSENKAPVNNK